MHLMPREGTETRPLFLYTNLPERMHLMPREGTETDYFLYVDSKI